MVSKISHLKRALFLVAILSFTAVRAQDNSLTYSSATTYAQLVDAPALNPTNISVEAWIYPTSWRPNSWDGSIVNKESFGTDGYVFRIGGASGTLEFMVGASGSLSGASIAGQVPLNTWTHVAGTYDGTNVRLYVNGNLVQTAAKTGNIVTNNKPVEIGRSNLNTNRYFDGKIDEVRIWNSGIPGGSIGSWYNKTINPCHPNYANLIGYYECNDMSVPTTLLATIGTNGTVNAGTTYGASANASFLGAAPTGYQSTTAAQPNSTNVVPGAVNAEAIRIEVETFTAMNATEFVLRTDGTTNIADITNAKLWYTGASSVFAATTQFGATITTPPAAGVDMTFTGVQPLTCGGKHYFWLSYDISASATQGNVIDATYQSSTVDAIPRTPVTTAPAGSRPILLVYCSSNLSTNGGGGDNITKVVLTNSVPTSFTQNSTGNPAPYYTSYNNTPLNLFKGTSNSVAITFGTDGTQHSAVWVDWNQNGVFEASENVALSAGASGGNTTVTYNFTVPVTATLGTTRIRVRGGSDGPYTAAGACATTTWGETEDYLVNIICPTLTAMNPVDQGICSGNAATFTATPSNALATLSWWDAATNGTQVGSGNSFTTGTLATNTTFYLQEDYAGCPSSTRTDAEAIVTAVSVTLVPIDATCNGNNNGSFTQTAVNCGTGPFLYSVNGSPFGAIPTDLVAGTYSVVVQDAVPAQSVPYQVIIGEPTAPTGLSVDVVNIYSADISWTPEGDESSWNVEYGPAGFTLGSGTTITVTSGADTTLWDLLEDTEYEFYVQAGCATGSDWAGPESFTTDGPYLSFDNACLDFVDIATTGTPIGFTTFTPNYYDDQNVTLALPWPWTVNNQTVTSLVVSVNGAALFNSGFPGYTPNGPGVFPFNQDLESNDPNAVYYQSFGTAPNRQFVLQWVGMEDYSGTFVPPGNAGTFEVVYDEASGEVYYLYGDVDFGTPAMNNGAQAAIALYTTNGNVTVSDASNTYLSNNTCVHFYTALCPNIVDFSSLIFPDEIDLSWSAGLYGETDWTVIYGYAGFDPTVSGEVLGSFPYSVNAAQLTGLTQNTEYDVYIYSECMADNLTSNGYFYTFITPPFCANPTTVAAGTDVDSLEVTWNWAEYDPAYPINHFNIMYEMDGVYSNEVVANGLNFADTVVDPMLIGSGVYQVYVQAVCDNATFTEDTSAWVGPITVVMPLSNDTVCGAEMLEMDYVYTLNNVGATVSVDEVNIAPPATGAQETDGWATSTLNSTVWYRFVAPPSGSVRINNTAIAYNGQLAVYNVADCGDFNANFTLVAANDNEIDGTSLAPNFTICGLTPGSVYYVLHDGSGTTGNYSISISEIVLQAGSAQPLTQICYGEILDLNTTITGNDTGGAWSASVAAVNASITGSDFNSNGLAYQTFDFQYRMTDGCAYDSIVSQVQVFAPSNAGIDGSITICKNEPVNLINGLSGTVDFDGDWYDPSDDPTTSDIIGSAFPGSFNYDYITGNGVCPDDTSTVLVIVLATCDENSIDEAAFAGVQLYPNPTSGIINIDADKAFDVEITDANGRMIKTGISTTVGTTSVDLGKVQVGVYFVTLRTEDASKVYRVVVQ